MAFRFEQDSKGKTLYLVRPLYNRLCHIESSPRHKRFETHLSANWPTFSAKRSERLGQRGRVGEAKERVYNVVRGLSKPANFEFIKGGK